METAGEKIGLLFVLGVIFTFFFFGFVAHPTRLPPEDKCIKNGGEWLSFSTSRYGREHVCLDKSVFINTK